MRTPEGMFHYVKRPFFFWANRFHRVIFICCTHIQRGELAGELSGLTQAERNMIDDLLNQGDNVEIIPRSNLQNTQTPDFLINGIKTELKTLTGSSLNTPVTRIIDGFKQTRLKPTS